jgi:cytochrome c
VTKLNARNLIWLISLACVLSLAACAGRSEVAASQQVPGGDPKQGEQALRDYGCHACHTIPGVPGAEATVGPPLTDWADRHYIAGNLPNTPDNLIRWIQQPQEIEPGTAMPNVGVTEQDARHISAYLYTLRRD